MITCADELAPGVTKDAVVVPTAPRAMSVDVATVTMRKKFEFDVFGRSLPVG